MNSVDVNAMIAFFLTWEQKSRDVIDFKKIYVDMADDLVSGLVLSQIVYWHLPGSDGITKLRVDKDGHKWIAKKREAWHDEIRVSPKQLDRALEILEQKGLVFTGLYGFAGTPTKHVRLNWTGFLSAWLAISTKGQNATFLPLGNLHFDLSVNSNTETTTETTEDSPANATTPASKQNSNSKDKSYAARAAADKLTKADQIVRVMAISLFKAADNPISIDTKEGRIKPLLFGCAIKDSQWIGLFKYEQQHCLDTKAIYDHINALIPGYVQYCLSECDEIVVSQKLFGDWWDRYRQNMVAQQAIQSDPMNEEIDDPERPGVSITRRELIRRQERREAYERSQNGR